MKIRDIPPDGFTIVEVLVTIVVLSVFLFFFFQAYLTVESQRVSATRNAVASDVAATNLKKFGNTRPINLTCSSDMDISSDASKPGVLVGDDTGTISTYRFVAEPNTSSTISSLGGNVSQEVRAYAPKGCGTNFTTYPVMLKSTVTYGASSEKVIHSGYVQ